MSWIERLITDWRVILAEPVVSDYKWRYQWSIDVVLINDEHKKQLAELWRILLQNGDEEEATPQFVAFLQMRIFMD